MDNIKMQEDTVLVSEWENRFFSIFLLIIFIIASLLFYAQMIVVVSWFGCMVSLILLVVLIFAFSDFFKKIYYFSNKNIVVTDHKNEYIGKIECNSSVAWNEYETTKKGTKYYRLMIQNRERKIIINKENYKNYEAIVSYCERSKFRKDTTIGEFLLEGIDEFSSKVDKKIRYTAILTGLGLLLLFGIIVSFKKDTGALRYYLGEIEVIKFTKGKFKKVNGVLIKLKNVPSLQFRVSGKENIEHFQIEDKSNYKPKKIKIGISKDDYDWKTG
jgi:hypothetical protein